MIRLKGVRYCGFRGCGISKLQICQYCAKTGEEKVIKNTLSLPERVWPETTIPQRFPPVGKLAPQPPAGPAFYLITVCAHSWKKQG